MLLKTIRNRSKKEKGELQNKVVLRKWKNKNRTKSTGTKQDHVCPTPPQAKKKMRPSSLSKGGSWQIGNQ